MSDSKDYFLYIKFFRPVVFVSLSFAVSVRPKPLSLVQKRSLFSDACLFGQRLFHEMISVFRYA
jgi:hypothetical protein